MWMLIWLKVKRKPQRRRLYEMSFVTPSPSLAFFNGVYAFYEEKNCH